MSEMQIHDLPQGSPEWFAYRTTKFNASDAPAMMGLCPHRTRDRLLYEMHTGLSKEPSDFVQCQVFDPAHRFEVAARMKTESEMGIDLYPIVGSLGKLSASLDGIDMERTFCFEHKMLNNELRALFVNGRADGSTLPQNFQIQMEQQLLVSGAEYVIFCTSDWDGDGNCLEYYKCIYEPNPELRARIVAGWKQFEVDLSSYTPPTAAPIAPAGCAPDQLPALFVEVTGQVTASNLAEFKAVALGAIRSVNRDLQTDQDFANAESAVKWCADVESRLAATKQHALSQTASIEALFRAIDEIGEEARKTRLELKKLVEARKEAVRGEIVSKAVRAYAEHVAALNDRIGKPLLSASNLPAAGFAEAIKGKRTIESLNNAVNTELARVKIESSAIADRVTINLRTLQEHKELSFLFADVAQLVLKQPEDLGAVVSFRVVEHAAKEKARLEAEEKAMRDRIERENAAKVEADAQAVIKAAQAATPVAPVAAAPVPIATVDTPIAIPFPQRPSVPAARPCPTAREVLQVLADHYETDIYTVASWFAFGPLSRRISEHVAPKAQEGGV